MRDGRMRASRDRAERGSDGTRWGVGGNGYDNVCAANSAALLHAGYVEHVRAAHSDGARGGGDADGGATADVETSRTKPCDGRARRCARTGCYLPRGGGCVGPAGRCGV